MSDDNLYKELDDLYDENGNLRIEGEENVKKTTSSSDNVQIEEIESIPSPPKDFTEVIDEVTITEEFPEVISSTDGATRVETEGEESYFDDDEEFLRGDSKVLSSEKDTGILQQLENVITWEVDNFYDETGKQRSRFALRTDPPVFRINSSDGDKVEFVLTKDLSGEMERIMGDVHRGYFGISAKDKKKMDQASVRSTMDKVTMEAKEHPLRFAVLILFVLTCIFYLFFT